MDASSSSAAGLLTIAQPMSEAQSVPTPPAGFAPQPGIAQRLLRLKPYFWRQRSVWALAIGATLVAALTEPLIPALFQPLLDSGFAQNSLPCGPYRWWSLACLACVVWRTLWRSTRWRV